MKASPGRPRRNGARPSGHVARPWAGGFSSPSFLRQGAQETQVLTPQPANQGEKEDERIGEREKCSHPLHGWSDRPHRRGNGSEDELPDHRQGCAAPRPRQHPRGHRVHLRALATARKQVPGNGPIDGQALVEGDPTRLLEDPEDD